MATVLDLILPQQATDFVRELFTDLHTGLPLERYFPYREQADIKVRNRINTRNVVTAKYRSYDAETPVGKRPALVTVTEFQLPPLGTKLRLGEEQQHDLIAAANAVATDPLIGQLYDDLETIVRGIVATLEIARGDLLVDGAMTLPTENLAIDVAWTIPSGHTPTAAILWDNLGGNPVPLADEIAWETTLRTDLLGFGVPVETVVSTRILGLLQRSAEYRSSYWGASNIANAPTLLNLDQLNSVRAASGLSPIVVNDEIIAGTRVLPDNKIFKIPTDLGDTRMGPTIEGRILSAGQNPRLTGIDVPGLVGVIQQDGDPPATWTKVSGVGMPTLNDANRFFTATVAS